MTETLWQSESTEEVNSSETTKQPDINFLLDGIHSYPVKIHDIDWWWKQKLLTAEEIQERLNEVLEKINMQWWRLIQVLHMEAKWKDDPSSDKPRKEKVYMFIVNKYNPFADPLMK